MAGRTHLATLVEDMARLGDQTAVVEHRGVRRVETSYAGLARGAAWFAAELAARGIGVGERVVLWGENGAAWIACFFGCVLRGVLVVPLDAAGTPAFAERIVGQTCPRLIVGDRLLLEALPEELLAGQGAGGGVERFELAEAYARMRDPGGKALFGDAIALVAEGLGPETPLQILFTSGTTGEPKGIVHTHGNLLASLTPIEREIERYRRYERWVHPLRMLHTLPLSHVFGQFMGLWVGPVLGAVVHYEGRLEAERLLRLVARERISVLAAVPRVLSLLRGELLRAYPGLSGELAAAESDAERIWRRWWRFRGVHRRLGLKFWAIVCGGATLAPELESFWTTLGVALIQGYGMTETSALVTLNHPFKPARGTLGAPLPGRELRLGANGELEVRGEMVARNVWHNGAMRPAGQQAGEGWLATGDLAARDAEGRLHYLGRTGQRLVTLAGLNVYFEDVEAALSGQPGVEGAVVVASEGPQGPEPVAVLRVSDTGTGALAVAGANAVLAAHQRVRRWWVWPELDLPRTGTGKIRRNVIEQWVERQRSRSAAGAEQPGEGDPVLRLVAQVTGHASAAAEGNGLRPGAEPAGSASLEELGLDSLGRVQLQVALERATGRSIPDTEMARARTLEDLRGLAGLGAGVAWGDRAGGEPSTERPGEPSTERPGAPPTEATGGPPEQGPGDASRQLPRAGKAQVRPQAAELETTPGFLYLRWPWAAPARWVRSLFLEGCVRPLVGLLAGPRVRRLVADDELLAAAPLLIVANHVTAYDLPLLLYGLPRALRGRIAVAAAGEMLEDWRHARSHLLGPAIYWLLTALFNVFPLPRSRDFRRAFEHAGEALDRGYSVLVYPEGRRAFAGPMAPFRAGIGLLAQQAAVPAVVRILPVGLCERRVGGRRPFSATVSLGPLETVRAGEDPREITARLEQAVKRLVGDGSVGDGPVGDGPVGDERLEASAPSR